MKKIKSLIRLHKFELDEKRRALRALEEAMGKMLQARINLDHELVAEQKTAAQSLELGFTYSGYAKKFIARREKLEEEMANLKVEIEKAEIIVGMAYQELKKYEITDARQEAAEKLERDRKEQAELDESGLVAHHRKKKN